MSLARIGLFDNAPTATTDAGRERCLVFACRQTG